MQQFTVVGGSGVCGSAAAPLARTPKNTKTVVTRDGTYRCLGRYIPVLYRLRLPRYCMDLGDSNCIGKVMIRAIQEDARMKRGVVERG
jgi:hypothetical protein